MWLGSREGVDKGWAGDRVQRMVGVKEKRGTGREWIGWMDRNQGTVGGQKIGGDGYTGGRGMRGN